MRGAERHQLPAQREHRRRGGVARLVAPLTLHGHRVQVRRRGGRLGVPRRQGGRRVVRGEPYGAALQGVHLQRAVLRRGRRALRRLPHVVRLHRRRHRRALRRALPRGGGAVRLPAPRPLPPLGSRAARGGGQHRCRHQVQDLPRLRAGDIVARDDLLGRHARRVVRVDRHVACHRRRRLALVARPCRLHPRRGDGAAARAPRHHAAADRRPRAAPRRRRRGGPRVRRLAPQPRAPGRERSGRQREIRIATPQGDRAGLDGPPLGATARRAQRAAHLARRRLLLHALRVHLHLPLVALHRVRLQRVGGALLPRAGPHGTLRRLGGVPAHPRCRVDLHLHLADRHGLHVRRAAHPLRSRRVDQQRAAAGDPLPPPRLQAVILLVGGRIARTAHGAHRVAVAHRWPPPLHSARRRPPRVDLLPCLTPHLRAVQAQARLLHRRRLPSAVRLHLHRRHRRASVRRHCQRRRRLRRARLPLPRATVVRPGGGGDDRRLVADDCAVCSYYGCRGAHAPARVAAEEQVVGVHDGPAEDEVETEPALRLLPFPLQDGGGLGGAVHPRHAAEDARGTCVPRLVDAERPAGPHH
mmetsp:Transcript_27090/g.65378  ORF Transcript_27090/g.65378 Transcript_27090/m.65378 type:complete len:584 (+) Transcript_27090:1317-3068(+)